MFQQYIHDIFFFICLFRFVCNHLFINRIIVSYLLKKRRWNTNIICDQLMCDINTQLAKRERTKNGIFAFLSLKKLHFIWSMHEMQYQIMLNMICYSILQYFFFSLRKKCTKIAVGISVIFVSNMTKTNTIIPLFRCGSRFFLHSPMLLTF